tara:strand:+ start:223 stop:423 length:201 start_codon:yes stop_codon:yes gene_type:complete
VKGIMSIEEKTEKLPDLLTVPEVASLLRFSQPTIKRWVREGALRGHQIIEGGEYRIEKEDILKRLK